MILSGVHDRALVLLSVLIAIFASYTALDLAARMRATSGFSCRAWLVAAAVVMGGGIWSMHFVGMLAYSLPGMEVSYDLGLTLVSLALPILVTGFGFSLVNRRDVGAFAVAASGLVMGLGIVAMHYTGMAAMRMSADLRHDRVWVVASLLIAIGASSVALWLAIRETRFVQRLTAAVVMGLAVSGMHYAAMQGATFALHGPSDLAAMGSSVSQMVLALWVATTTLLILGFALVAAMIDRTYAQKLAGEAVALRHSEERFRRLVQSVTDYAIFMLDPEGRIANWNAGAERIKGYSQSEVIGRHFSIFYTEEDQASGKHLEALETAARTGKFEVEAQRVRKDGSRFWASVIIDPVHDDEGHLIGFAKVTRDITERKALEKAREALFQAQKMEAIGQLTGGVAHDFNNLLMAILGSLDLMKKRLPPDPKLARLLDNAMQGAQRGASLTQRMLAFARRQHLRPEPVDLRALVNGLTTLLQQSVTPAYQIETRFPLHLTPAFVDPHQLELALLNLVVNARDAMPDGGTISIFAKEQNANTDGSSFGQQVCLGVSDTGIGMDADTLARAQEPFFTTKGIGKGTGLGLSMVHGLAEQSAGRLVLNSAVGKGTTAEIWLPAASERPGAASHASSRDLATAWGRTLTVMVVDDDPLVLENTAAMLEDMGHHVIEAASGPEALALLDHVEALDVVITDQVMPHMTGLELARRIGGTRPNLPIIMATGYAEAPEDLAFPRLQKPFRQEELARAIAEAGHLPRE